MPKRFVNSSGDFSTARQKIARLSSLNESANIYAFAAHIPVQFSIARMHDLDVVLMDDYAIAGEADLEEVGEHCDLATALSDVWTDRQLTHAQALELLNVV